MLQSQVSGKHAPSLCDCGLLWPAASWVQAISWVAHYASTHTSCTHTSCYFDDFPQVSEAAIKQAQRAEREAEKMKGLIRARFDFLDEI